MKYILLIHGDETAIGNLSEAERQRDRDGIPCSSPRKSRRAGSM